MFTRRRTGIPLGLGCALALLGVLAILPVGPGLPVATNEPSRAGVVPESATSGPLSYHANVFVNSSAPSGSFPPGEVFAAVYDVQVPGYTPQYATAQVRIPNVLMQLPSSAGPLRLYFTSVNFTVTSNGVAAATAGPSVRFGSALTFNASQVGFASTQGLAVVASWPYGALPIGFRWHWVMTAPDGSSTQGPWSNWASVVPAQIANLVLPAARTWVLGSPLMLCLNGPIAGRTFSSHVSVANPVQQFDTGAVTVAVGVATSFCWNTTLPAGVTPQQGFIHLWEYSNVTFLLSVAMVQLVNDTSTHVAAAAGGTNWVAALIIGAILVVVVIAFEMLYIVYPAALRRLWTRTPAGPDPAHPPSPPSGAVLADSTATNDSGQARG